MLVTLKASGVSASAHLVFGDKLKLSLQQLIHDCSYGFPLGPVIHFDPHLLKSHKGAHSDAADNDCVCAVSVEKIYRRRTSSLHMRGILKYRNLADFAVFSVNKGKDFTVTEVSRPHSIQAAGVL